MLAVSVGDSGLFRNRKPVSSFGVHVSRSTGVFVLLPLLLLLSYSHHIQTLHHPNLPEHFDKNGCHHSQFVVEEAVAISETQVQLGFLANPVVSGSCCGTDGSFIRSTFSNQIDRTANGISIHIRGDYLAYFDGLYHIGRNKVELHITCVAFGRREAVAVDGHGTEVGGGTADLSEASFPLVVLYINTVDTFEGIADIGIGELSDLIG